MIRRPWLTGLSILAALASAGVAQAVAPVINAVTNLNYAATSSVVSGSGDFYLILWGSNFVNGTTGNTVKLGTHAATILYSSCSGASCQLNLLMSNGAGAPLPVGAENITLQNANGTSNVIPFTSQCTADSQCGGQYCSMANTCSAFPNTIAFSTPTTSTLPAAAGQAIPVSASVSGGDLSQVKVVITDSVGTTACQGQGASCTTAGDPYYAVVNNFSLYSIPKAAAGTTLRLTATAYVQDADPAYNSANHQRAVLSQIVSKPVCAAGMVVRSGICAAPVTGIPQSIGVVDWGSSYQVTSAPKLVEGATFIKNMGAQSISIALTPNYTSADYPGETFAPGPINSLTDLIKTNDYQAVLNMPFRTVVLELLAFSNRDYLGTQNLTGETQEISNLVTYLMQTYQNTGKTFILKNWEGDNAMSLQATGTYPNFSPSTYVPPTAVFPKMIALLNARHQGLLQGRTNAGSVAGVTVHDAAEISMITPAKWSPSKPCMLTAVIPSVQTDMISYSAYDTTSNPRTDVLYQSIASDVALIKTFINSRPLMIGEFGYSSNVNSPNAQYYPDPDVRLQTANLAFLESGAAPVFTWVIEDSPNAAGMGLVQQTGGSSPMLPALQSMINPAAPAINSVTDINYAPINSIVTGSGGFWLLLWGTNFSNGAANNSIYFGTLSLAPTYAGCNAGACQINVFIPNSGASTLAPGIYCLRVQSATGNFSGPYAFKVLSNTRLTVTPPSVQIPSTGSTAVTYTFGSTGFTPNSAYGVHAICWPAGCGDLPLVGTWSGNSFVTGPYAYDRTIPAGNYLFQTKDMAGTVYTSTITIVAPVGGSSVGGGVALTESLLNGLRVYPNPWKPGLNAAGVTFDQMPSNSTVKIFTVSARLVKTLSAPSGSVVWDLTNDSGERAASGIYLYLATNPQGDKTRGKFVIIR